MCRRAAGEHVDEETTHDGTHLTQLLDFLLLSAAYATGTKSARDRLHKLGMEGALLFIDAKWRSSNEFIMTACEPVFIFRLCDARGTTSYIVVRS
jgi:hypothetical protein